MKKPTFLIVTTVPQSLQFFRGQIQFLKQKFEIEILSSSGDWMTKICERENVKGHVVEMEREISIFKDIYSLFRMLVTMHRIHPDIVHGNTPKGGFICMLSAFLLRISKRIYYIHGLRYEGTTGLKRKLLMKMESLSCWFATDIIVVSKGVMKSLKKDGITQKQTNLIHHGSINGIDSYQFSLETIKNVKCIREQFGIPQNAFVFGFVGRIVKDKGINELIKVFVELNQKYKNTYLLLVGKIELKIDPISLDNQEEIKTNPHIIYAGIQSDVRPFLRAMNVFTFPSYREGFGISLMEAQAMEIPCISSNISGCNEIIQDMENGFLIEPRNEIGLFKAMEKLLLDTHLYASMKGYTRKNVVAKYEQQKVWQKALETYSYIADC